MAFTAEQLARAFSQNGGLVPSAGFNASGIYDNVLPSMGGGNTALNAINAATPTTPMQPASWMAYEGGMPVAASVGGAPMPPMPRARPGNAPTRLDMAAIGAQPAAAAAPGVTRVAGRMEPQGLGGGLLGGGGLLSLLMGKSKNGLPGLPGLLGGPQQGGLLQLLFGGQQPANSGAASPTLPAVTTVGRRLGTNGYVYGLGSNGQYYQQGQSPALAGLTPSQQYSALTGGPGSVAAMEILHNGGSRNPQSGGPAGGGEYGGGR